MEKPKNYKQYVGKKVRIVDKDLHTSNPSWYPKAGTVGTIIGFGFTENVICVDWGENSGVDKNLMENKYAWAIGWSSIEFVDNVRPNQPNMTDEEIWEMFKPKMEKLGINPDGEMVVWEQWVDEPVRDENGLFMGKIGLFTEETVHKLVSVAYKSGYGRGQKGRPFVIGKKKQQGPHWEWIKPDEIVPDGTKVRYMKRRKGDDGNDSYYPKIGQECIKLNAPGFPDSNFWVQFEGSEYEFTCLDHSRDCFQKWVGDNE